MWHWQVAQLTALIFAQKRAMWHWKVPPSSIQHPESSIRYPLIYWFTHLLVYFYIENSKACPEQTCGEPVESVEGFDIQFSSCLFASYLLLLYFLLPRLRRVNIQNPGFGRLHKWSTKVLLWMRQNAATFKTLHKYPDSSGLIYFYTFLHQRQKIRGNPSNIKAPFWQSCSQRCAHRASSSRWRSAAAGAPSWQVAAGYPV